MPQPQASNTHRKQPAMHPALLLHPAAQGPSALPAGAWLVGGFTLVEVLVTVAILGLLMALAMPSFSALADNWRVRQATEALVSTLQLARSEAIKRGGHVIIQKLPNSTHCPHASGNREWGCGWLVCHDSNSNNKCDDGTDPVLQHITTPAQLQICRRGGADTIQLNRWGMVQGTWPSFNLRPAGQPQASLPSARALRMSSGGRIRTSTQEDTTCTG